MRERFHCGKRTAIRGADFSSDEREPQTDENGLVHTLHCPNCGTEITHTIREKGEE